MPGKKKNKKKSSKGSKPEEEEEEECEEQREARELLRQLRMEQTAMQSMFVGERDPQYQMLKRGVERRVAWLEAEVVRPASQRMAKSAGPPRDVLKAAATVDLLEAPGSCPDGASGILLIVRYVEDDGGKRMYMGFEWQALPVKARIARMPWKREFGFWPVESWAWYLALLIRKAGVPKIDVIQPTYKMQVPPTDDFSSRLQVAFSDVCRTHRMKMSTFQNADFEVRADAGPDLDHTNDQALYFDATLWTVARDLGFPVDDRSQCPAFTYKVGDYGEIVIDPSGRQFDTISDYVRFRLTSSSGSSPAVEHGNKPAVEDHLPYLVALLEAMVLPMDENHAGQPGSGLVDMMVTYEKFRAKKLGSRLRKVATEFNVAVPDIVAKDVMKRCAVCDKAEGTFVDERTGTLGTKLRCCPCSPNGPPWYCSKEHQVHHFRYGGHNLVCTYVKKKPSSSSSSSSRK